jgi:hypothetical protein
VSAWPAGCRGEGLLAAGAPAEYDRCPERPPALPRNQTSSRRQTMLGDARVNIDYHIEVERHYYSVPYALVHQVSFLAWVSEHKDVLLFQHVTSRESSSAAC